MAAGTRHHVQRKKNEHPSIKGETLRIRYIAILAWSTHIYHHIAHELPALDERTYDANDVGTNVACQLNLSFLHSQLYMN
jgi:hypothetical protein